VLLAIFTFSLSLLGTFLVRSGVLTSVHAFASDPARGRFILIFLTIVIGLSLLLYAWRAPKIKSTGRFSLVSLESALLLNNVILVVVALSILLGTLYPIVLDALNMGKISVGPPYFDKIFVWLTVPLAVLLGFGVVTRWKQDSGDRLLKLLRIPMLISVVVAVLWIVLLLPSVNVFGILGAALAVWIVAANVQAIRLRVINKDKLWPALKRQSRGFYGMTLAHMGVGMFVVGITLTSIYSSEKDVRLAPGESYSLGGYTFMFEGVKQFDGPNYLANQGHLEVTRDSDGKAVASMYPQKRVYRVQRMPMTEAAIDAGLGRDLFVALGEPLGNKGAWSLRMYHKPYIRWIWLGALIMGLGGLLAATDRRYRVLMRKDVKMNVQAGIPAGAV